MQANGSSSFGPLCNMQDDDLLVRLVDVGPQALTLWEILELIFGAHGGRVRVRIAVQRLVESRASIHALLAATHADLAPALGRWRGTCGTSTGSTSARCC